MDRFRVSIGPPGASSRHGVVLESTKSECTFKCVSPAGRMQVRVRPRANTLSGRVFGWRGIVEVPEGGVVRATATFPPWGGLTVENETGERVTMRIWIQGIKTTTRVPKGGVRFPIVPIGSARYVGIRDGVEFQKGTVGIQEGDVTRLVLR